MIMILVYLRQYTLNVNCNTGQILQALTSAGTGYINYMNQGNNNFLTI